MSPWFQEFWRMLSLTLGMLFIGLLVDQTLLFFLLFCLTYLSWHLYNLYRLDSWFSKGKKIYPPEAPGIWGEVFYHFYRLQQRNRKRKRKLGEMLKRFQESTAAMPDATVVLGPNYEIEWFNKAACQLLGLQSPRDRGQPITNLIRYPSFYRYLANDNLENTTIKFVSPSHPEIMLSVSVIPYGDNQHLLLGHDITQLHRLEQIRSDFIANVSHELRTPLTVIAGFLETMRDAEDCTQEFQRPLLLMAQQTARMRNIVEDLLFLSRLESEPATDRGTPVVVADLLKTIYEEAQVLSGEQHHITLEVDETVIIYGHTEELHSAFSNLVYNAVRYTPPGGDISIRWYQDAEGIHLAVHDTGEGIAPEHLPRLTERFYRIDVGRSRLQGGTGLGLAIVKHVLNRHKGHLHIESEVGKGSLFRCDFPHTMSQTVKEVGSLAEGDEESDEEES
jgi:two-component system phosphate regulon sensor histidine kinase PhoR